MTTITYTADQIIAIGGRRWIPGGGGAERVYLNDWPAMIGLQVEFYGSGSVRSATLRGADLSNRRASKLLSAKVWLQDGTIHTTLGTIADSVGVSGAELVKSLHEAIAQRVAQS